jgi:hypothetical protein
MNTTTPKLTDRYQGEITAQEVTCTSHDEPLLVLTVSVSDEVHAGQGGPEVRPYQTFDLRVALTLEYDRPSYIRTERDLKRLGLHPDDLNHLMPLDPDCPRLVGRCVEVRRPPSGRGWVLAWPDDEDF